MQVRQKHGLDHINQVSFMPSSLLERLNKLKRLKYVTHIMVDTERVLIYLYGIYAYMVLFFGVHNTL